MADATIEHVPDSGGSARTHNRRKIAFLHIGEGEPGIEANQITASIGDVCRSLYVLHCFLHRNGDKDGAALADVLSGRLEEQNDLLRELMEIEVADG